MKTTELEKVALQVRRDIVRMVHGVAFGSFYCNTIGYPAEKVVRINYG